MADVKENTTDRVNLVYKTEVAGTEQEIELPLRLLVLSDMSADERSEYFEEQHPVAILEAGLKGLFANIKPQVKVRVKNLLTDDGEIDIVYPVTSLDDFLPENIVNNTPELKKVVEFIDALGQTLQNQAISDLDPQHQGVIDDLLKVEGLGWDELKNNLDNLGWLISNVEERVTSQLDAILHHSGFSSLEASWRSLNFLIERIDFSENCEISVLNISKQGLMDDFEDAPEVMQSNIYQSVYSDEFGQYGGRPYAAIIGNYQFGPKAPDVRLLQKMGSVGAISHAPFIAAASHEFFDIDSYSKFSKLRDVASIFGQQGYEKWNSFRESEDARYVALTMPSFLLRQLHESTIGSLEYREKAKSVDTDLLWGNAAFALATRIADSFAKYRWCLNITGKTEGLVKGLTVSDNSSNSMKTGKIPTQFLLTDKRESDVIAQGFIPLSVHKGDDTAAFYSAYSVYNFKESQNKDQIQDLTQRLGAQIPYLLIISRISHYIKMMQREHIGSWKNRRDVDTELNNWLKQYVSDMDNPAPGVRGRRPLRRADIKVREVDGKADWFLTQIQITPHIKYMGNSFTLSETSKLEKA